MKNLYNIFFIIILHSPLISQIKHQDFSRYADSLIVAGLDKGEIPGATFVIVHSDSIIYKAGYGYSNLSKQILVSADSTRFQVGSIGKVFTAIAVLQEVEKGRLNLDEDIQTYLTDWEINNPYKEPVKLTHLLTHSAGFDDRVIGYMARDEASVKPLGDHLKKRMPKLFQKPGSSINYSNYGYALAGHLVEIASNQEFKKYINRSIFTPLNMSQSTYYLPESYRERESYAIGYEWNETMEEVSSYPRHAIPAGSLLTTAGDMGLFLISMLNKSTILNSESFTKLFDRQYSNHPLLNGYTIGFEEQNIYGVKAIAKGGTVPGFLSEVIIYPDLDLALFISVNTETDNFLSGFFESLHSHFLKRQVVEGPAAQEITLNKFSGHYRNDRANHHSIEELFAMFQGHFQIFQSADGYLGCYHDGKYQKYVAKTDSIFYNIENPEQYLIFDQSENGKIRLFRNVNIMGLEIPATFSKLSWFERPKFINDEIPYVLLAIPLYLLMVFYYLATLALSKLKGSRFDKIKITNWKYHTPALLFAILFIADIALFFVPLIQNLRSGELFFGFSQSLYNFKYLHLIMCVVAIGLIMLSLRIWKHKNHWLFTKVYFNFFTLACVTYMLLLYRWHFIQMIW